MPNETAPKTNIFNVQWGKTRKAALTPDEIAVNRAATINQLVNIKIHLQLLLVDSWVFFI